MEELEEKDLETKPGAGQASPPTEEAAQHLERALELGLAQGDEQRAKEIMDTLRE